VFAAKEKSISQVHKVTLWSGPMLFSDQHIRVVLSISA